MVFNPLSLRPTLLSYMTVKKKKERKKREKKKENISNDKQPGCHETNGESHLHL